MMRKFNKFFIKLNIHDKIIQISLISSIIIDVLKLESEIEGISPVLFSESKVSAVGQLVFGFSSIF